MEENDSGSEQPSTPISFTNIDVERDNTSPNIPSFEEALQSDAVKPPNKRQKSIAWDKFVKNPKNGIKHLLVHRENCIAKVQTNIRQKLLVSSKAKMVIFHEYPFSIVENVGFKNFTRTVQPLFKCPCRNTLKSDIKNVYAMEKMRSFKRLKISKVELPL
uniref:Uncharacterized protein n=1 Tax=Lactuca sativa TaxID=4236 RepID=A0A9R1VV19_LACSA|nr:hypothetical protein LSAT_V11C400206860 [Lactuca sativa]